MSLRHPIERRRIIVGCVALAALISTQSFAAGVIYRCESASGVIEYSNSLPATTQGCEEVALPAITTIPAPAPVRTAVKSGKKKSPDFPRVDASKQRKRDSDRARILRDELDREQKRLALLRNEFNNGEPDRRGDERNYQKYLDRVESMKTDISRSEGNIKALQRELAALKP